MADFQVIINSQVYKLIPSGRCACGCGRITTLAVRNGKGYKKGEPHKFIQYHWATGENSHAWQGGEIVNLEGYKFQYLPNHPRADQKGYVRTHVLTAEKAFGKPLPPKSVVHHHTPEQLVVCQDQAYHMLLHKRQRAYIACGHASWRKCPFCKKHDAIENMHKNGLSYLHKACANEYAAHRRANDKV